MQTSDQILNHYTSYGFMKAGELLLRHADAVCFLEDCLASNVPVLGMSLWIERSGTPVEINSTTGGGADALLGFIREGLPDGATWVSFTLDAKDSR